MVDCDICGEPHKLKYVQTLGCNHSFHYECIQKSFMSDRKRFNQCPLCRTKHGLLPIVKGLPKLVRGIHYNDITKGLPKWECSPCHSTLQSGKRKGLECGAKSMIGFDVCKRHHLSKLKKEDKLAAKEAIHNKKKGVKVIKLGDALEQVQVEQLLEVTSA
jgi:hypothetical protein